MPAAMDTPSTAPRAAYVRRINGVLDHINAHLGDTLDLQTLAAVAHFSPWHFHRIFQAMTGETLADCVRRLRLEAAAQRLLTRPPRSALAVALAVGFASPEVFARAFKAYFGSTPTEWRRGAWREWATRHDEAFSKIHQEKRKPHQASVAVFLDHWPQPGSCLATINERSPMQVQVKTLPAMRLAYMRSTGPYGGGHIGKLWARFAAWCAAEGPMTQRQTTYGIGQDNPAIAPADKLRYDCCVAVGESFLPQGEVGVQDFSGGRYACAPFKGTSAQIHAAWMQMYGQWLPESGWQADDKPGVEVYGEDFEMDPATGIFTCETCVPVRPL